MEKIQGLVGPNQEKKFPRLTETSWFIKNRKTQRPDI